MLKRFFLASASVLMLALAYHLGASTATASLTSSVAAMIPYSAGSADMAAITVSGEVYVHDGMGWHFQSSINGPVPAEATTWGGLKSRFR